MMSFGEGSDACLVGSSTIYIAKTLSNLGHFQRDDVELLGTISSPGMIEFVVLVSLVSINIETENEARENHNVIVA